MKRKKVSVEENVSDVSPFTTGPALPQVARVSKFQKANKDNADVADIKRKIAKVNLYLSLVNKGFFTTVGIDEVDVASEIETEVNDFLISKAKSVFSNTEGFGGLSATEWAFLKMLSKKGTQTVSVASEPKEVHTVVVAQPVVAVEPEREVPVAPKVRPGTKPNTVKKVVSIIGEDGNPKEVEVETEKMVIPPASIKRHPPATFEQQLQRASQDVAAVQRAFGTSTGPLVVDSSDSRDF